jgi:hypothetical protein
LWKGSNGSACWDTQMNKCAACLVLLRRSE